jgi:hypothetical protein
MKRLLSVGFFAFAMLAGAAEVSVSARFGPPPPPPREVIVARPGPRHVWVPGHYSWDGRRYVWASGYWTVPPRGGAAWTPGRWERRNGMHIWVEGRWR